MSMTLPPHPDTVSDRDRDFPAPEGEGTLLLVTAVRLRKGSNGLQLDDQTCAGLCRWAERFGRIVYAGILLEEGDKEQTSTNWVDVDTLPCASRLKFIALPMAYRLGAFARTYRATRRLLADEIRQADHLCFTIGYVTGDWAAIAALEAIAQQRRYAVWLDRVEHEVLGNVVHALPAKAQFKERATLLVMERYHSYIIRRSSLALLQGMDTFNAYARFSSNPACVYDVHTSREDFATEQDIEAKLAAIRNGEPLRIVYVGRADEMKGPMDWLDVIGSAIRMGVPLKATWIGDGPLLPAMRAHAGKTGIADHVTLAGHVGDRRRILSEMCQAHIFLFCHKTPESPRCLIEALVSACPIVGYASNYPAGLIMEDGGGRLSPMNAVTRLAEALADLNSNREELARLVKAAAKTGRRFDEEKLYRHRAELIAAHV
ncbi:glycosyltransferase [Paracoccus denitrificans]|uniref:glycosyltransferase n=1 Tax=Paracoccus denitrificans TaxID=266 RepID=UPI00131A357C|nr:glycosyltransferase [Paracoccus denitrificans]